ncbi:protein containg TPR repeat [Longilinea arvoryzae]|uniref:Protein containg TPR repeat n=1 Tax=Longilinea arvoryzae TaxID=360412 RepID=A0A0S7BAQ7_9CHLR|nr:hypothetical protein [Longilinea arvoryzae]GAP14767.1 protein containg TPR repeat [Longilinea arvoryzae]
MAKIPLRAYNREIENLINRGQIDEAVGHCKHILRFFPKHIDTYRLLGKAYLEGQHYSEASDVLQRVLSCIPDDFVSQIGMSIIREDEGNLDAAIWHMERAFEVQPANTAVQGELRRLYGRRDGIEPPKVRLTRGALVRMYARGELYQQAIGEIRAALAEDPKRIDIEVILAQMYFFSAMKVEATEVCSRLITKLPFCFEANRILAEILPETARAEDAKIYQQRVDAMEPYMAYLSKNTPTLADVPDNVVTLDRLEWEASETTAQKPEWARTVGIEWEEQQESLPEWMASAPEALSGEMPIADESAHPNIAQSNAEQSQSAQQASQTPEAGGEEIPEWMKAAGWGKSTGPETPPSESAFLEDDSAGEGIASGNIPDWLQAMAPQESSDESAQPEDQARLDLLANLLPQNNPLGEDQSRTGEFAQDIAGGSDLPNWMKPENAVPEAPSFEPAAAETPDWMKSENTAPEAPSIEPAGDETPDWMKSMGTPASEAANDEMPDWMKSSGIPASEAAKDEMPDWMKSSETPASEPVEDETPDWLKTIASSAEAGQSAEQEGAEMPDWLKSEEAPVQTETPQDETPFTPAASENPELQPIASEEQPVPEIPSQPASAPASENPDDAFAWLEALATRQGAAEETLLTKPEDRTETPPDWLQQASQSEPPVPATSQPVDRPAAEATETGAEELENEVPDWLKELESDSTAETPDFGNLSPADQAAPEPVETPAVETPETSLPVAETGGSEEIPDWLKAAPESDEEALESENPAISPETEQPQPVEKTEPQEQPAAETSLPEMSGLDSDSAFAWLESLAAKQGADEETLLVKPEERLETPPDWVKQQMSEPQPESAVPPTAPEEVPPTLPAEPEPATPELPDWLASKDEEVETGAAPQESVPAWLKESTETAEESKAEEAPASGLPDWLTTNEPPVDEAAAPVAESPLETPSASAEIPTAGADDAFAWLESLAAKQGADEETLLLKPEDRVETPPEWVTEQAAESQPAPEAVEEPELIPEKAPVPEAEEQSASEDMPDWLKDLEISSEETNAAIDLAFQQPLDKDENSSVKADAENAWMRELPETSLPEQETTQPAEESAAEITHPVPVAPVAAHVPTPEPAQEVAIDVQTVLSRARSALKRGKTQEAVVDYLTLIQNNQALEETLQDLKEAVYQHPVDIDLWQTIGDVYAHSSRLQDALDAYTKAEELLR